MVASTATEELKDVQERLEVKALFDTYINTLPLGTFRLTNLSKDFVNRRIIAKPNDSEFSCIPELGKFHSFCLYAYRFDENICGIYLLNKTPKGQVSGYPDFAINRGRNEYWGLRCDDDGSIVCEVCNVENEVLLSATTKEEMDFVHSVLEMMIRAYELYSEESVSTGELE